MKRFGTRRLMTVVLSVLIAAMLSTSVLAAYVPTAVTYKDPEGSTHTQKMSFNKKGNITKRTEIWYESTTPGTTTYKWKGKHLVKVQYNDGSYTALKYKKGVLTSSSYHEGSYIDTTTFHWKKKSATITYSHSDGPDAFTSSEIYKRNGKKQLSKVINGSWTVTYKYYGNGNLKSITYIDKEDGSKSVYKYNKNGYIISRTITEDGETFKTTYKYKMDKKKKCPKSVTVKYSGGDQEAYTFSKFKKVKQSRNCDAWGNVLPLGVNSY